MDSLLDAAWRGAMLVLSWPNILYPVLGTLLAMVFSSVPGLTGVTLMALAIPLTLGWDPLHILLLFGAFVAGATFMGSASAILLNVPGKASSAAVMFDGYPMAQKGLGRTALGCAAFSSALGSSFGVLVLVLLIPLLRRAILYLGPPEFLMLVVWGLTTVSSLTGRNIIKNLAAAGVGLLISFVGMDSRTAEMRYTFGSLYLQDGLSYVPVLLGIFAVAETIHLVVSDRPTISGRFRVEDLGGSIREGIIEVFRNFGLFLRSSVIGTVVGIIPGVGGTVASFVAYGHAAQTARGKPSNFGNGDIRGVIAPEAAVDAKDGGSLVPTLAFGIPGGSGTALLLAVLTLHGIAPGKELMSNHLDLVFVIIWSLFLSNWMTSIFGLALIRPLTRLTVIQTRLLAPVILVMVTLGTLVQNGRMQDLLVTIGFGIGGYFMKKYDWSRVTLVIALLLGPLFEEQFHITLRLQELGRINFFARPVAVALLVMCVASLVIPRSGPARRPERSGS